MENIKVVHLLKRIRNLIFKPLCLFTHHPADWFCLLWELVRICFLVFLYSPVNFIPFDPFLMFPEWRLAFNHFINQAPKTPPIRAERVLLVFQHFWSYKTQRKKPQWQFPLNWLIEYWKNSQVLLWLCAETPAPLLCTLKKRSFLQSGLCLYPRETLEFFNT